MHSVLCPVCLNSVPLHPLSNLVIDVITSAFQDLISIFLAFYVLLYIVINRLPVDFNAHKVAGHRDCCRFGVGARRRGRRKRYNLGESKLLTMGQQVHPARIPTRHTSRVA